MLGRIIFAIACTLFLVEVIEKDEAAPIAPTPAPEPPAPKPRKAGRPRKPRPPATDPAPKGEGDDKPGE